MSEVSDLPVDLYLPRKADHVYHTFVRLLGNIVKLLLPPFSRNGTKYNVFV